MLFRFIRIFAVLTAVVLLSPSLASAADADRGEILFDTCIGCHGAEFAGVLETGMAQLFCL